MYVFVRFCLHFYFSLLISYHVNFSFDKIILHPKIKVIIWKSIIHFKVHFKLNITYTYVVKSTRILMFLACMHMKVFNLLSKSIQHRAYCAAKIINLQSEMQIHSHGIANSHYSSRKI